MTDPVGQRLKLPMRKTFISLILLFSIAQLPAQNDPPYAEGLRLLDTFLSQAISEHEPGLSVCITHQDQIKFEKYYGCADLERNLKLSASDVMGIASVSKQFTGMACLILVEEEKLHLDDLITDHLPGLAIGERNITVRQLLSHTSGLPELTQNETFMQAIEEPHTIEEIIEMGLAGEFRDDPGNRWQYCNTGYTILSALIEKLSGDSYSGFLQENLFKPLGMAHSFSCDYHQDATAAVPRYFPDSVGFQPATTMHFSNLIGGGAIISNVRDMSLWSRALLSGVNLPENYQQLFEPTLLNSGESIGYGLGIGQNEHHGKLFYYHPGMGDGMNSVNVLFPDEKITINVIRNISKPSLTSIEVVTMAADLLFDK